MNSNSDIFDKLMQMPGLKFFEPFYKKHKEILLYLFFGGLTFCISISSFAIVNLYFAINEHISNIISWVLAVTFAYVTNRKWVFKSTAKNMHDLLVEIRDFFLGRVLTLVIEELIVFVFITKLHFLSILIKVVAQVVVIILNYILSKVFVFKEKI